MNYSPIMRQDYDKKIKFGKKSVFCYSKGEFNRQKREHNFVVVGKAVEKGSGDNCITINQREYKLISANTPRLWYYCAGYVQVDNTQYVALLKSRLPLLLLLLVALAGVGGAVWFAFFRPQPAKPVNTPVSIDPDVSVIEGDTSQKQESEDGGGAVTLTYSLNATLTLSTGDIQIYFLNPNASNHNITLALYVLNGDTPVKIAESGLIQAGYGLTVMHFDQDQAVLSQGEYSAQYIVSFYDPATGQKAKVESTITDVKLQVLP